MKLLFKLTFLSSTLILTGCIPVMPNMLEANLNQNTTQVISFKTNQVHFINTLKGKSNQNERNAYLEEFLLKSDMQCQNYLNSPLKKPEIDTNKNSLYMNLFDSISTFFGVSLVTNTAKAVFLGNDSNSLEEKRTYANALSPEIRKGVEIGRKRYAKTMLSKKRFNLKIYSINHLKEDILKYDKQCNDAYGLIEINRALRKMQNSDHTLPAPSLKIDPKVIKDKVEAASKEVEKKKLEKEDIKSQIKPTKSIENIQSQAHSIQL